MTELDEALLDEISKSTAVVSRIADAYSRAYKALHQLALDSGEDIEDVGKRWKFYCELERITMQLKNEAT